MVGQLQILAPFTHIALSIIRHGNSSRREIAVPCGVPLNAGRTFDHNGVLSYATSP